MGRLKPAPTRAVAAAFPHETTGQNPAPAREVTFARDVAPIVYRQCAYCHRPGEVAPFSLLTYQDARPWARAIKQAVTTRQMPPWNGDPHFGDFRDPRRLSDREIATIAANPVKLSWSPASAGPPRSSLGVHAAE